LILLQVCHSFLDNEVTWKEAEKFASSGGLALASWKNTNGGSGHIAVVTGGYTGAENKANMNIFQAGARFGAMKYSEGFGALNSRYYVWRRK
jgi:hypothetical protein